MKGTKRRIGLFGVTTKRSLSLRGSIVNSLVIAIASSEAVRGGNASEGLPRPYTPIRVTTNRTEVGIEKFPEINGSDNSGSLLFLFARQG